MSKSQISDLVFVETKMVRKFVQHRDLDFPRDFRIAVTLAFKRTAKNRDLVRKGEVVSSSLCLRDAFVIPEERISLIQIS